MNHYFFLVTLLLLLHIDSTIAKKVPEIDLNDDRDDVLSQFKSNPFGVLPVGLTPETTPDTKNSDSDVLSQFKSNPFGVLPVGLTPETTADTKNSDSDVLSQFKSNPFGVLPVGFTQNSDSDVLSQFKSNPFGVLPVGLTPETTPDTKNSDSDTKNSDSDVLSQFKSNPFGVLPVGLTPETKPDTKNSDSDVLSQFKSNPFGVLPVGLTPETKPDTLIYNIDTLSQFKSNPLRVLPVELTPETPLDTQNSNADVLSHFKSNPFGILPESLLPYHLNIQLSDSAQCSNCVNVITAIQTISKNNESVTAFISLMVKFCNSIVSEYQALCEQIVPAIIKSQLSKFNQANSTILCTYLLQCGDKCKNCKMEVAFINATLSKKSFEQQFIAIFTQICTLIENKSNDYCNQMVTKYFEAISEFFVSFFKTNPCEKLGECQSKENGLSISVKSVPCTACAFLLELMERYLGNNSTDQEIKSFLENECKQYMPKEWLQTCDDLIDRGIPLIIDYLEEKLDPYDLCAKVKLCNNSDSSNNYNMLTRSNEKKFNNKMKLPIKLNTHLTVKTDSIFCSVCLEALKYIENYLEENSTEQDIENFLENECKRFIPKYINVCDILAEEGIPFIIEFIEGYYGPQVVCTAVKLCANTSLSVQQLSYALIPLSIYENDFDSLKCATCEYLLEYVNYDIGQNATKSEMEAYLGKECTEIIPKKLNYICGEFINTSIPLIVQFIEDKLDPHIICTRIGLCSDKDIAASNSIKSDNKIEMAICSSILDVIIEETFINEFIYQINRIMCQLRIDNNPQLDFLGASCSGSDNINKVRDRLQTLLRSAQIKDTCIKIFVDQPQITLISSKLYNHMETSLKGEADCFVCLFLVRIAKDELAKNQTSSYIEDLLHFICSHLEGNLQLECEKYGSQVVLVIIDLLDKPDFENICRVIGACNQSSTAMNQHQANTVSVASNADCLLCTSTCVMLNSMAFKDENDSNVHNRLLEVCRYMGPIKDLCYHITNQYFPWTLSKLRQGTSPSEICTNINMCNNSNLNKLNAMLADPAAPVVGFRDSYCSLCTVLVEVLAMSSTESKQISLIISSVCERLGQVSEYCMEFVNDYLPQIFDMLNSGKTPKEICELIGVCELTSDISQTTTSSIIFEINDKFCDECKLMVEASKLIINTVSESDLETLLLKICAVFGGDVNATCHYYVSTYISYVLSVIKYVDSAIICEAYQMCNANSSFSEMKSVQHMHMALWEKNGRSPTAECTMCSWIAQHLTELSSFMSESSLNSSLMSKCDELHMYLQESCHDILTDYKFKKYVRNGNFDLNLCYSIGLCKVKTNMPQTAIDL